MPDAEDLKKIGEVRLGKIAANLISLVVVIIFVVLFVIIVKLLPHGHRSGPKPYHFWVFLGMIIVNLPLHELLHAYAAVRWGKAARKDIKFSIIWWALLPFMHCRVPISVRAYRIVTLLPLYVLGTISIIVLLAFPNIMTAIAAAVIISGSTGDILIFLKLRPFESSSLVKDHHSEIGCDIFEQPASQ
jgi:hypothetical protein